MSRSKGSGSGPFLMEMVIAAGFFMLCVAVCVSAFVRADMLSRNGKNLNYGIMAAESLVEEVKNGKQDEFDVYIPDGELLQAFDQWKKSDAEVSDWYQSIKNCEDHITYQAAWDEEWNLYKTKEDLEKTGKKMAYAGIISTGTEDQMKKIAVVILNLHDPESKGSEIFHIFTEQYVKP